MQKLVFDSIIVGAGISGLVLARRVKELGQRVLIIEKSRGLGGRIATRRDGEASYDHGAQFYKVSKNNSFALDQLWASKCQVFPWVETEDFYLKCAAGGLTSIPKSIADKSTIAFEKKVQLLQIPSETDLGAPHVKVYIETGEVLTAKAVYLTAPLPQSLEILDRSEIEYPAPLSQIKYAKALVGLFEVQSDLSKLKEFKYGENVGNEIYSISNQLSKKVSTNLAFTVVMQPDWSEEFFEKDEGHTLELIAEKFESFFKKIDPSAQVTRSQLKKWRYSHPTSLYTKRHEILGKNKNIIILGDAFGGGSIRGAIDSAESVEPLA